MRLNLLSKNKHIIICQKTKLQKFCKGSSSNLVDINTTKLPNCTSVVHAQNETLPTEQKSIEI